MHCGGKTPPRFVASGLYGTRGFHMTYADPDVLFCRLRCAADYGIKAARDAIAAARGQA